MLVLIDYTSLNAKTSISHRLNFLLKSQIELKPQDYQYGVMMDAGSSGTRFVFYHDSNNNVNHKLVNFIIELWFQKTGKFILGYC